MRNYTIPLAVAVTLSISIQAHSQTPNCERIERSTDAFNGKVTLRTDLLRPIAIIKETTSRGKATYYARLKATGATVVVDGRGAHILFNDGSRWSKPVEIDVDAGSGGFDYSAFIHLTAGDLKMFSTKLAARIKLYVFESEISSSYAEDLLEDTKCMATM